MKKKNAQSVLLRREMERLINLNGLRKKSIQLFLENYRGRKYRRGMVFLLINKLIKIARTAKSKTQIAYPEDFEKMNCELLGILEELIKGGKEEERLLLSYCETVKKIPGARISPEELAPWTKQIILSVGLVIQAGRERERSCCPPY